MSIYLDFIALQFEGRQRLLVHSMKPLRRHIGVKAVTKSPRSRVGDTLLIWKLMQFLIGGDQIRQFP